MAILEILIIFWKNYTERKMEEFFLHTCGGPASRYRVKTGCNEYTGNQQIIPVDINTAKDFTEKNGSVDDYINLFGMPEE